RGAAAGDLHGRCAHSRIAFERVAAKGASAARGDAPEKETSPMAVSERPFTLNDYKEDEHNTWCPQCGDFAILNGMQRALAELHVPRHMVAMYSGIGCSGKLPHYMNAYGFHTLHGRVVPNATGAKLANRDLTVLAVGGDGDGFGIGCGYFINAGRRNVDMT